MRQRRLSVWPSWCKASVKTRTLRDKWCDTLNCETDERFFGRRGDLRMTAQKQILSGLNEEDGETKLWLSLRGRWSGGNAAYAQAEHLALVGLDHFEVQAVMLHLLARARHMAGDAIEESRYGSGGGISGIG